MQGPSNASGDLSVSASGEGNHPSKFFHRTWTTPRNIHTYNLIVALEQTTVDYCSLIFTHIKDILRMIGFGVYWILSVYDADAFIFNHYLIKSIANK